MNLPVKIVSAMLVLMLGAANAFAEPGHRRNDRGDERAAQRDEQPAQRQVWQGGRQDAQNGDPSNAVPVAPRRRGGMSPEERRALREQINEAGRDIYRRPNR